MDAHRDRPSFQATAPASSQGGMQRASEEVAGGMSLQEVMRRLSVLFDAPDPSTPPEQSEESAARADVRGDRRHQKRKTSWQYPQADSLEGHCRHKRRREESGSTSSDGELSYETEFLVSDQGGHDDRCPKRHVADSNVCASKWTLEEWQLLLTTGDASDSKESSDDDGKPQRHAKPSVPKAKWSAANAQRSIVCSLWFLHNKRKEAAFRALALPSSIDHLETDAGTYIQAKSIVFLDMWRQFEEH
jgi:hypothetical protein